MWPFTSKEDREINKTVQQINNFIVSELKNKGLISLYLAGTILWKKERTHNSDIDFFGIVSEKFKHEFESKVNNKLAAKQKTLCNGYESRFRAFPLSVLKGEKEAEWGTVKFMRPERILQRFPFFKLIWGKNFNFKKDFLKPMSLKQEARYLIPLFKKSIIDLRTGKERFPYTDFPKHIFELVRIEAMKEHNLKYTPERQKLVNHLKKEKNHIIHEAMRLRNKKDLSRKEVLVFANKVELYVKEFEKKIKKWK
jgi:hypothetical protein